MWIKVRRVTESFNVPSALAFLFRRSDLVMGVSISVLQNNPPSSSSDSSASSSFLATIQRSSLSKILYRVDFQIFILYRPSSILSWDTTLSMVPTFLPLCLHALLTISRAECLLAPSASKVHLHYNLYICCGSNNWFFYLMEKVSREPVLSLADSIAGSRIWGILYFRCWSDM